MISLSQRKELLEWLFSVAKIYQTTNRYKIGFKVWEHAVFLFDQCLAKGQTCPQNVKMRAATCFLVASKFEEDRGFTIENVQDMCDGQVDEIKVRQTELIILKEMKWRLGVFSPAEISSFLVKLFWTQGLGRTSQSIPQDLQVCIWELVRAGLLLDDCQETDYASLAVAVLLATFEILDLKTRDLFLEWVSTHIPCQWVALS